MLLDMTNLESFIVIFIMLESRCSVIFMSTLSNLKIGISLLLFLFLLEDPDHRGLLARLLILACLLLLQLKTESRHPIPIAINSSTPIVTRGVLYGTLLLKMETIMHSKILKLKSQLKTQNEGTARTIIMKYVHTCYC